MNLRRVTLLGILTVVVLLGLLAQTASATVAEPKDVGGDGWDDLAVLYNYGSGRVAYFAFESTVSSLRGYWSWPRRLWSSTSGWDAAKTTPMLADATGDGKADVISIYAYAASTTGLLVTPGSVGISSSRLWWKSPPGGWANSKTKWSTGPAFSGSGPHNPVALYDHGGNTSSLWLFKAPSAGTFKPTKIWQSPVGGWSWARSKMAGGDFNGDGSGDVAILYDYTHNRAGLWLFMSNGTKYAKTRVWLSAAGAWDWSRSQLYVGDVDGDGSDEVVVPYIYTNKTRFFVFQPMGGGTGVTMQNWGTSGYTFFNLMPMTLADLTHDHKVDIVLWGTGDSDRGVAISILPSYGTSFETETLYEGFNDSNPAHWDYAKTKLAR